MSASPAFSSRSDCPIPYVPEIIPDLVKDCVIPPVPDPFFEAINFPPILPPIPLGCPSISFSGSMHSGSPFSVSTHFSQQDGIDNCFPILNFDLQIPFECASISIRNIRPSISSSMVSFSPSYRMTVTQTLNSAPWCNYRFDLDIVFPCTSISVSPSWSQKMSYIPSYSMSHSASLNMSSNTCDLNLGLLFDLVFPCHSLSMSASGSIVMNQPKAMRWSVINSNVCENGSPVAPGQFLTGGKTESKPKLGLELDIPCCKIDIGNTDVDVSCGQDAIFTVTARDDSTADECRYRLDFDLRLPGFKTIENDVISPGQMFVRDVNLSCEFDVLKVKKDFGQLVTQGGTSGCCIQDIVVTQIGDNIMLTLNRDYCKYC